MEVEVKGSSWRPSSWAGWHWRPAPDKSWGRIHMHSILQRASSIAVGGLLGGKLKITLTPLYVHECMCVRVHAHPLRDQEEDEDLGWILLVLEVGECEETGAESLSSSCLPAVTLLNHSHGNHHSQGYSHVDPPTIRPGPQWYNKEERWHRSQREDSLWEKIEHVVSVIKQQMRTENSKAHKGI